MTQMLQDESQILYSFESVKISSICVVCVLFFYTRADIQIYSRNFAAETGKFCRYTFMV